MRPNYNEELENEMDELLKPLYEYGYDGDGKFTYLLDELENSYVKTDYPGFLYRIGLLYEECYLEPNKLKDYKEYYERAAEKEYVPAMNKLSETCLDEVNFEMMFNGHYFSKAYTYDDPHGKYLLAKYYMMQSIYDNTMKGFFKVGLEIMKESANSGHEKAIQFMKTIDVNEIGKILED